MSSEKKLAGKRALVTGAGTGIGLGIALEFARQGADVVLHYSHTAIQAESAVKEIRAMGRRATGLKADFNVLDDATRLAEQAIDFLGGLDCLVNNSGITLNKPFLKTTREQFDVLFNVNIRAPFFLTQRVVQQMLEHAGGAICNLASVHGFAGAPEHSVYAATKGAIVAYTRALGIELAHKGIRVNAIAPGWVKVEGHFQAMPGTTEKEYEATASKMIPLSRVGRPLDIAKLAVFLCSDDSEFIVGQTIIADGGTIALMSCFPDFRAESTARFGVGYVPGI